MIRVECDPRKVNSFLKGYASRLSDKCTNLLDKVAEVGELEATRHFMTAQYDGTSDVWVSRYTHKNESEVCAYGNAVCFIEYGTGVFYEEPYKGKLPEGIANRGEYGSGKGANPPWKYPASHGKGTNGVPDSDGEWIKTYGNPPAQAMYYAGEEMRRTLKGEAKEIFK